jgi:GNAT superfamily N-acetyltransferase
MVSLSALACRRYWNRIFIFYALAVRPDFGRRGIGRDLVLCVIEESKRRSLSGVTLTTFKDLKWNAPFKDLKWNAPFYEKLGFRILESHERSAKLNSILSDEKATAWS